MRRRLTAAAIKPNRAEAGADVMESVRFGPEQWRQNGQTDVGCKMRLSLTFRAPKADL